MALLQLVQPALEVAQDVNLVTVELFKREELGVGWKKLVI